MGVKQYFGRERVVVGDGRLRVVRNVGPLRRDTSVLLTDITSVEVPFLGQAMVRTRWGLSTRGARADGRLSRFVVAIRYPPLEAERIAERIRDVARK